MTLARRVIEHFVAPAGEPWPAGREDIVSPNHADRRSPGPGGRGYTVDPADAPDLACADPAPRTPPGIAVLSTAGDALVLGAGLGIALARSRRSAVAAVCVWTERERPRASWRAPALPRARRLASALAARGHRARASGRLVVVDLVGDGDGAAVEARRAAAAAGDAPTVLALGGPRTAAFDELLREQDLVVLALPVGSDPALATLAVDGLTAATARTCTCDVPPAPPARALAGAGIGLLPSARRALAGAVEALP